MFRRPTIAGMTLGLAAMLLAPSLDARQSEALRPLTVTQLEGAGARQLPAAVQGQAAPAPPLTAAPVTQLDLAQPHPILDGTPFSLTFADARPVMEILRLLFSGTGLSFVPQPGLDQTFVGELNNVTLREALDLITEVTGLDYSVQGNVVRVGLRALDTRIYSVDYVITRRTGSRTMSASTGAAGVGSTQGMGLVGAGGIGGTASGTSSTSASGGSTSSVGGTDSPDMFGDLEAGIQSLLSAEGTMTLNRTAALLQVTDRAGRFDLIERYLEATMMRATRQVQIEATVIEVELNDEFSAGINWRSILGSLNNAGTLTQSLAPAASGGFTLALNIGDFSSLLNAFATQGKVNVLSSPRVTAMNNEPAVMRIGTQDVFFTTTTQVNPDTGAILQTSVVPQTITEGVVLSVTAQIAADGIINMSVNPSVTERTGQATSRLGDTVPIVSVRETDTRVRVREGETIVIGGLMQDRMTNDATKVPLLGDVPVVGGLFRRTEIRKRKVDLVILFTPTVMNPNQIEDATSRDIQRLDTARDRLDGRR